MPGPLDYLKALHLPGLGEATPELTPEQRAQADAVTTAQQANDPSWMKAGRSAVDGLVGLVKGATGLGDQGPSGPTSTNLGQVLGAALPLVGGLKGAGLPGMFSRVDAAADTMLPEALHPVKAESIFKNNAAKEEISYRGLDDFLKGNQTPRVTKADIQTHLADHPMPEIGVVDKGGQRTGPAVLDGAGGVVSPRTPGFTGPTQYSRPSLNVPGGSNYQERLLTLPAPDQDLSSIDTSSREFQQWHYNHYGSHPTAEDLTDPQTIRAYMANNNLGDNGVKEYQSSHWDEPNVLAHSRFDERTLATDAEAKLAEKGWMPVKSADTSDKGRIVGLYRLNHDGADGPYVIPQSESYPNWKGSHIEDLPPDIQQHYKDLFNDKGRFLQEVQSDWHQAGKEGGYQTPPSPIDLSGWSAEPSDYGWTLKRPDGSQYATEYYRTATSPQEALERLHADLTEDAFRAQGRDKRVPDAPFKDSWPDLVMKQHVLDVSGRPDLNWLGFTTGDTQNARYDLNSHISKLHYDPQNQLLTAFDTQGNVHPEMHELPVAPQQLPQVIGREAAQNLLAQPPQLVPTWNHPQQVLDGGGLTVGGAGMKHFYDEKLPSALGKILKPFGGSVERGEIPGPAPKFEVKPRAEAMDTELNPSDQSNRWETQIRVNGDHVASAIPRFTSKAWTSVVDDLDRIQAMGKPVADLVRKTNPSVNHGTPAWIAHLPPEMKAAILKKGLPLLTLLGLTQAGQAQPASNEAQKGLNDARPD